MFLSVMLSLAAVAQTSSTGAPERSAGVALAEAAFRSELKDPGSAQFTWPYGFQYGTFRLGSKSIDGWITCGTLNAKNSFGGYVGAEPALVVIKDGIAQLALVDRPYFNFLGKRCAKMGMPVG